MKTTLQQNIAISIVLGSILVAVSILYTGYDVRNVPLYQTVQNIFTEKFTPQRKSALHRNIYGNEKAETIIVEFSDFQCPYCAQLHTTLKKIVDESNGTIAWEYRHLPLPMHKDAVISAKVSECVAILEGSEAFWEFGEILMTNQKSITPDFVTETARSFSLPSESLATCVESKQVKDRIENDKSTATALGGSGTPFSVIVYKDGTYKAVSGALPYSQWMSLLEDARTDE